jgi:Flp pilus assembly protein TadG
VVMRWLRDATGQALVESALIFTILITMALGMMDFGFVLKTYASLITASGAGALAASNVLVGGGGVVAAQQAAQTAVTISAQWHCTAGGGPTVVTVYPKSGSTDSVSTTVSCTTQDLTGLFPSLALQHETVRKAVVPQ